jgi:hypothetical protein
MRFYLVFSMAPSTIPAPLPHGKNLLKDVFVLKDIHKCFEHLPFKRWSLIPLLLTAIQT